MPNRDGTGPDGNGNCTGQGRGGCCGQNGGKCSTPKRVGGGGGNRSGQGLGGGKNGKGRPVKR